MQIAAFSTATGAAATQAATGVIPITFPPQSSATFHADWLKADVLYFHLHGMPDQPYWYGDQLITALGHRQIEAARLAGAVVFVANCYGAGSELVRALYTAGAVAVVAGPGQNYTVKGVVRGADLLGQHFIAALKRGLAPDQALAYAKSKLRLRALISRIERDALQFTIQAKG